MSNHPDILKLRAAVQEAQRLLDAEIELVQSKCGHPYIHLKLSDSNTYGRIYVVCKICDASFTHQAVTDL